MFLQAFIGDDDDDDDDNSMQINYYKIDLLAQTMPNSAILFG